MLGNWLALAASCVFVCSCSFDGSNQVAGGGSPNDGGPGSDADGLLDADLGGDTDANPSTSPPEFSPIPDQSTARDAVTISFSVSDPDTPLADLLVTAKSGTSSVVPNSNSNLALSGSGGQRTLIVTPVASGTTTLTLKVYDGTTIVRKDVLFTVSNTAPSPVDDSYLAFGNTDISVSATSGVLSNDSDTQGDTLTAAAGTIPTALNGTVIMAQDGSFTYEPPVGITAQSDSFSYVVSDGFEESVGNATIAISELIWYVKNDSSAASIGTRLKPFKTLLEAQNASGTGDTIFVYAGDPMMSGLGQGIVLKNNQRLLGERVGLDFGVQNLVAAGVLYPRLSNAAGHAITLAQSNTVRGILVENASGSGVYGAAITNVVLNTVQVEGTGQAAIYLHNPSSAGLVTASVRNCVVSGNLSIPVAIDIGVAGNAGGFLDATASDNIIIGVGTGLLVTLAGSTGTGGTRNFVSLSTNRMIDLGATGIEVIPSGTSANRVLVEGNLIDGIVNLGGNPTRGVYVQYAAGTGGLTSLSILKTAGGVKNIVRDFSQECVNIQGVGGSTSGELRIHISDADLSNCGMGLWIAPNQSAVFLATVESNLMTANNNRSTFSFGSGSAPRFDLNLKNNEDDRGYLLERPSSGMFKLAGSLGTGMSFSDDNGNIRNNSNSTGGQPANVNVGTVGGGTPILIDIVNANTIPTP